MGGLSSDQRVELIEIDQTDEEVNVAMTIEMLLDRFVLAAMV